MSDQYKDWPLVPVDPACVPEGWEAVRVGVPKQGESYSMNGGFIVRVLHESYPEIRLIIRPIPKPIRLPVTIVPPGWWVAKDNNGKTWIYKEMPIIGKEYFICDMGSVYRLPPPIAAQLPAEYLALPWDKSLMQQTEGM